jgi:hypothetical protein
MTQFLTLRQVFENFLDRQDHFANFTAALAWLLSKTHLTAAKPSIMA